MGPPLPHKQPVYGRCSALTSQYPVLRRKFSVLNNQYPVESTRCSVVSTQQHPCLPSIYAQQKVLMLSSQYSAASLSTFYLCSVESTRAQQSVLSSIPVCLLFMLSRKYSCSVVSTQCKQMRGRIQCLTHLPVICKFLLICTTTLHHLLVHTQLNCGGTSAKQYWATLSQLCTNSS